MAITRKDFEDSKEFNFEFQEGEKEQIFSFVPIVYGNVVGLMNIEVDGYSYSVDEYEVVSIHKNYAILQFDKFDRKYTYKLHFQNCNPI